MCRAEHVTATARRLPLLGGVAMVLLAGLAGCGEPAVTNAPVVIRGDVNGVLHYGYPASCGTGPTTVVGAYGPNTQVDVADLTVSDEGSITFDLGKRGKYTGNGVAFRPGSGWDIDASLRAGVNASITIKGHVSC
jgi:hypothetical protein